MAWKEPEERHNDAIIEAIHHAAALIAKEIRHMADTEAQALSDLSDAVTAIGTAVAIEVTALQNAINTQGMNNSPAIEASVAKLRQLASDLKTSAATETPPLTAPVVTSIAPTSGGTAGGDVVTVTGTGLSGATTVTVGGLAATSVSVSNDTTMRFTTPASVAGLASVVITGPGGPSSGTPFTYA